MDLKRKLLYIYILLWVMYYLQGTLYPSGSSISQTFLALALSLSGYLIVRVNNEKTKGRLPQYIVALNILLVLVTLYGIALMLSEVTTGTQWTVFLKEYYYSLLPIYAFYYFTKRGLIQQREITIFTIVFVAVTVLFFYKQLLEVSETLNREEVTNNAGYMFIPLLALLPILEIKKIFKYSLMIILAAFVLLSAKRGAIVTFVVCAVLFLYFQVKESSNKTTILTIAISVIILVIGYRYSMTIIENDVYLSSRLEDTIDGNSSSRDIIYNKLVSNIMNENSILHLLFGYGANGTRMIAGRLAHNDWLEIFIDMGLFGFIAYLYYWFSLWKSRKYIEGRIRHSLYIIITFCFLRSFFSMSINDMYVVTTFIIGYCVALSEQNKIQYKREIINKH